MLVAFVHACKPPHSRGHRCQTSIQLKCKSALSTWQCAGGLLGLSEAHVDKAKGGPIRTHIKPFIYLFIYYYYLKLNSQTWGLKGYMVARGKFRSNPNLLFIYFKFWFSKPNNLIWHQSKLDTCQKVNKNYIYNLFILKFNFHPSESFIHNLDVKFSIQRFHPFIFILFYFIFIQSWMKGFHPSLIFSMPYLPHIISDFNNFHIIGFVLASSTQ
jgi:hypothetical protein